MKRRHWTVAVLLLAGGSGCYYDSTPALKRRASFDLQCPEANLILTPLSTQTRGVQGCGQRATYMNQCGDPDKHLAQTGELDCPWVLNTDGTAVRPQASEGRGSGPPPSQ